MGKELPSAGLPACPLSPVRSIGNAPRDQRDAGRDVRSRFDRSGVSRQQGRRFGRRAVVAHGRCRMATDKSLRRHMRGGICAGDPLYQGPRACSTACSRFASELPHEPASGQYGSTRQGKANESPRDASDLPHERTGRVWDAIHLHRAFACSRGLDDVAGQGRQTGCAELVGFETELLGLHRRDRILPGEGSELLDLGPKVGRRDVDDALGVPSQAGGDRA